MWEKDTASYSGVAGSYLSDLYKGPISGQAQFQGWTKLFLPIKSFPGTNKANLILEIKGLAGMYPGSAVLVLGLK